MFFHTYSLSLQKRETSFTMISKTYVRYLWLLNTLTQYKRLTFEEIQSKWDKSVYNYDNKPLNLRTFHIHKNAVEEMFNLNIECDSSDGYKYYIDENIQTKPDIARQWLINSFNVVGLVTEGQQMQDRILLENIPAGAAFLSTIMESIKQSRELHVMYQPFYEDDASEFTVQPYCMKVFHQRWYVLGYFRERNGLRNFALDRTLSIEMTDTHFTYPNNFSPEDYYRNSISVWVLENEKPQKVVLRAYGIQAKYLRTLPLQQTQKEINTTTEYSDFEYYMYLTPDLPQTILSKGAGVEVLEPAELIDKIRYVALNVVKKYSKNIY